MNSYLSLPAILSLTSLVLVYTFSRAVLDIYNTLSPQGCRMSWMSPSYILQVEFNSSWTPLANRYSLWLYREVGWEPNQAHGVPVLFIPGNAGSSHQVRSIASSASRQYFASPFVISDEFQGRGVRPLDFFAVEFNEDLSAFHGPTLDSQISYTSAAISYILSHYPPNTHIIVMGHSMGGIVGTALLPSEHISALITMSTPHMLPPARFDARIDEIYDRNDELLREDHTPILSICGGATDAMIPSESCILSSHTSKDEENANRSDIYRKTVLTSALEGAWTGVGHLEMVWCHQVRWRIARAALELGLAKTDSERAVVLDRWLRDDHTPLPAVDPSDDRTIHLDSAYETLPENTHLVLKNPTGPRTYLLPISTKRQFVLYVSQGSISPISPQTTSLLRASVKFCVPNPHEPDIAHRDYSCTPLAPTKLHLLPSPIHNKPFPVPNEGSDESEGVVLFEGIVPDGPMSAQATFVGVVVESADANGGIVGGFDDESTIVNNASIFDLMLWGASVGLSDERQSSFRTRINFPNLMSHTLFVYKLTPSQMDPISSCEGSLLAPLLMHTSSHAETHYFPLRHLRSVSLHTHNSAPYVSAGQEDPPRGVDFTIYESTAECNVEKITLDVDWWATIGRIGSRYPTTLVSWSVGIVALVMLHAWGDSTQGKIPDVEQSLFSFMTQTLPKMLPLSLFLAFIPFGPNYYLGIKGETILSAIAPILLLGATGLVCVSWWLLTASLWTLAKISKLTARGKRHQDLRYRRGTIASMLVILVLIFMLVPWQVAFLGCWVLHFQTCISDTRTQSYPGVSPTVSGTPVLSIPLLNRSTDAVRSEEGSSNREASDILAEPVQLSDIDNRSVSMDRYHQNTHILLLMTWLLPFTAPVLVVWVRTMLTAGFTAPFNGDHNVLKVAPFLILVDHVSQGGRAVVWQSSRLKTVSPSAQWGFLAVALVSFFVGARQAYSVYDAVNGLIGGMMLLRMAQRYLNRDTRQFSDT